MKERRQGFVNNDGDAGRPAPRRRRHGAGAPTCYAEARVELRRRRSPRPLGVRSSEVRYESDDHYVTAANPDDSGVAQVHQHEPDPRRSSVTRRRELNLYASYGAGLRDADVRRDGLQHGRSRAQLRAECRARAAPCEIGAQGAASRAAIASTSRLFHIDTDDEIVDRYGDRRPQRRSRTPATRDATGAELLWDGELPWGLHGARRADLDLVPSSPSAFTTGSPPLPVPVRQSRCPACRRSRPTASSPGRRAAMAASTRRSKCSTSASSTSTIATPTRRRPTRSRNLRAGLAQTRRTRDVRASSCASTTSSTASTSGSVIVGDTNGRFFEPAPGRNWFVGVNVDVSL